MDRPTVVITNRVHDDVLAVLEPRCHVVANAGSEPWSCAQILNESRTAVGLMAFMTDCIDRDFLSHCPELRIIASVLKGFDNFDVDACTANGIWLTVVQDRLTTATAELTIGMMIALSRNIVRGDACVRGTFSGWRPTFCGLGLDGSSVGIVGLGAIGRAVAERLKPFGCLLRYFDEKPLSAQAAAALGVQLASFDQLLEASDFLVLAVPLSPGTRHMFNPNTIRRVKRGCFLINTARGSLVDEEAVAAALAEGRLAGYAADVFEMEDWARPDRPSSVSPHLLADRDRTVLTPHIGSAERNARRDAELEMAHSILDYLAGSAPRGAVNRPLTKPRLRHA